MQAPFTIIIKTFERPGSLKKLLSSIERSGYNCPVIVADDSRLSLEAEIKKQFSSLQLSWIKLPFDSGLSAGRNELIKKVTTPYFVLCDDDFVLDARSDLNKAVKIAADNQIDILGGDFYNYVTLPNLKRFVKLLISDPVKIKMFLGKEFTTSRYLGDFKLASDQSCELLITNLKPAKSPYICDLVNNFFVAGTKAVLDMGGWDAELKLGEHEDFFFRAKLANLKVAYLPDFGTAHHPVIRSNYKKYRLRAAEYKNRFVQKHAFKKYTEIQGDTGEILFTT